MRIQAALLVLFAVTPACGVLGIGKQGADLETDVPTLEVSLALDRPSYGRGAPLLATVTVTNVGTAPVSLPRPSPDTVRVYLLRPGNPTPFDQQIVRWPLESPEYVPLEPGQFDRRTFVLPLATQDAGSFEAFAVYHSEPNDAIELAATVASPAVPFAVDKEIELERDEIGLVTKEEAVRIARAAFGREGGEARAVLVKDPALQMMVWWVTLRYDGTDGGAFNERSCFVNPYLGRVKQFVDAAVPEDRARD